MVEDTTFPVRENDLVIVNPNVEHTELSLNDQPAGIYRAGRGGHGIRRGRKR
ncbi:MAG: hypothetical protein V8T36_05895 [Ruthenibacterium lactatiformans]